jgi:hypothetical protein
MGGQKPHLLVKTINNLGAETRVEYVPSTKFYLQDKRDGKPWITRLPFPVHVVERVETYDHISRNRFVTRYVYHHGYFDGEEREFRGFGMVEQWDTEQFAALADGNLPPENIAAASHVPPVHTKTWCRTAASPSKPSSPTSTPGRPDGQSGHRNPASGGEARTPEGPRSRAVPASVVIAAKESGIRRHLHEHPPGEWRDIDRSLRRPGERLRGRANASKILSGMRYPHAPDRCHRGRWRRHPVSYPTGCVYRKPYLS